MSRSSMDEEYSPRQNYLRGKYDQPSRPPLTIEVIGQCQHCLDLFSVTFTRTFSQYRVNETANMKQVYQDGGKRKLVHWPGRCDGEVKLYGNGSECRKY